MPLLISGMSEAIMTDCQTQKDMKRLADARSICLDAYGADSEKQYHHKNDIGIFGIRSFLKVRK